MRLETGSESSQDAARLECLESMAIEMPEIEGHPNRVQFRGVLTLVDAPSDKPPSGARGHRVLLTGKAVEEAIPSLLGMAVDYTPSLDGHDARAKIGVVTSAELESLAALRVLELGGRALHLHGRMQQLKVGGYLYGKDFPEVVGEMRAKGKGELGMSYEIADVHVADVEAAVWAVTKFTFTGAAVLLKNKAAYQRTWIEITGREATARAR
jgi:hypothetical protein